MKLYLNSEIRVKLEWGKSGQYTGSRHVSTNDMHVSSSTRASAKRDISAYCEGLTSASLYASSALFSNLMNSIFDACEWFFIPSNASQWPLLTCPYGGCTAFMTFAVMLMMGAALASPQARHLATCVTVCIEIDRRTACTQKRKPPRPTSIDFPFSTNFHFKTAFSLWHTSGQKPVSVQLGIGLHPEGV